MPDRAAQPESPAEEKIQVTPEMIEAGKVAYWEVDDPLFHHDDDIVEAIYRAMERRRLSVLQP